MSHRSLKYKLYKSNNIPRKIRYFYYVIFNRILFNLAGIKYGKNLLVYNKFYLDVEYGANIKIGDNFNFKSGEEYNSLSRNIRGCIYASENAKILIGNNVGISSSCILSHESISIGDNVKIGADSLILDSDCHSLNYEFRKYEKLDWKNKKNKPIEIGDDVLIGTRCIILKGVTIGKRCIIGSGCVLTKNVPDDSIAFGNPCVIRKLRND